MAKKSNLKISKNTFAPVQLLEGKNNFKRYFRIARNGSIKERVFLNVPDIRLREQIICLHYISFYISYFTDEKETVGINFLKRDEPWDFDVELSNGQRFNVEITSIADNTWLHEKMKREEMFEKFIIQEEISVRELEKFQKWFGGEKGNEVLQDVKDKVLQKGDLVKNPYFKEKGRIYLSDSRNEEGPFYRLIMEAINKKNEKPHQNKESTVLIIDNRTSRFEMKDYHSAMSKLENTLGGIPFPQIYLYTGYYSDNDGNNAEYSFAPIKQSANRCKLIKEKVDSGKVRYDNKTGVAYD